MTTLRSFVLRSSAFAGALVCAAGAVLPSISYGQADTAPGQEATTRAASYHHPRTLEQMLGELKVALQINSDQESLWQAYVTAATNQAAARKQWFQNNPPSAYLTLPQRIDRRAAMMQQLLSGRQAKDAALKQLYAALTPSQQLTLELSAAHMRHEHRG